ncbi:L,D-transpeptidase family protein [Aestuariivita boseongensis]|uniref:L,D-transpeptidase family protein n=1 Tax=Aestuariivita boseongensis TaxID=1470562 RepID=UPI0006824CC6|nr:L,D-transpeptidase family protein [Aestuariivita boseongensis]
MILRELRALVCVLTALLALLVQNTSAEAQSFQEQLDQAGVAYQIPREGKAILINIPAFELIAFEEGEPVLRSRVIVGAPYHRTPRLETYVTSVRFRPTWRPTPSMIASGEYADYVRPPGERNPLGLAAVRLQPGLLVYLHDTNRRELFEKEYRALSHGCVRVQQWDRLVAFVLGIELSRVHELANGTRTFDAPADPIPVTLGYFTRFPDPSGQVLEHPDIYGLNDQASLSASNTAKNCGTG